MSMFKCRCTDSWASYAPTVLRVFLGIVFAVHGWQKFNEMGLVGVSDFFTKLDIPMATFFAGVVIFVELIGGIALILGVWTHWVAKLIAIDMLVAMFLVHWSNGFYISNGGYEFTLILFAASVSLILSGSGKLSIDEWCGDKTEK